MVFGSSPNEEDCRVAAIYEKSTLEMKALFILRMTAATLMI